MKIAIFSGTFDPIHNGHTALIEEILSSGVEKVFVMTEQKPRRKSKVTDYAHRKAMIQLALDAIPNAEFLEIDDEATFELVATFRSIESKLGSYNEYSLVMGVDVLEHLHEWGSGAEFDQLLSRLRFIIALRTEDDGETAVERRAALGISMDMVVSPQPKISSSSIRSAVNDKDEMPSIHLKVLQYIRDNSLY